MIPQFFTENIGWKLLSLVVAVAFWMNVASEPELETIISVPVEYEHYPKDLDISSTILDSVDVEAKGPRGRLRDLADSRVAAVLNFASVETPGVRTFTLGSREIKLPRGLELVRTIPAQLQFTFEHKETRDVPVELQFSGKLASGWKIRDTEILPPQLPVMGPRSHVERTRLLKTDPFDLSRVTGDTEQMLAVFVDQPQVRVNAQHAQVRVRIRVEKTTK